MFNTYRYFTTQTEGNEGNFISTRRKIEYRLNLIEAQAVKIYYFQANLNCTSCMSVRAVCSFVTRFIVAANA